MKEDQGEEEEERKKKKKKTYQALLVRGDTLLVLDFLLDSLDGVRRLHLEGDSLPSKSLHEDLHLAEREEGEKRKRRRKRKKSAKNSPTPQKPYKVAKTPFFK